ncbi:MAG: 50S ribosomal protein L10 [Candidatus Onthovivens sp.]|nr:50S ribosomal protein L10 [Mollicutes bacterium]MDD6468558.1 50S ribosomal protein L10 [Bacilli bacterium]MDY2723992.1 50S ribosomal protein L10 [Candidatus Onthovivens sp.]MCI6615399.1 50S ribosomal protein L10 [Mollicutes bacterium]MCI7039987.1 50S ribosomal protein L10 [Mollicutes bacterium]
MNKDVLKQKESIVKEVSDLVSSNEATVVCEYRGLTVKQMSELRKILKKNNALALVYKNSLVARATEGKPELGTYLAGPNLFVFCKDATNGSLKDLAKFAKKNEALVVKGGLVDGEVRDEKYIKTLASLPSKEGMLSMLLSVLQAPIRNLAYSIKEVAGKQN